MATLKLAIDRQSKTLVVYNGSTSALPPLTQGNQQSIQIQLLDPDPTDYSTGYAVVNGTSQSIRLKIFSRATGTASDADDYLLASQLTWSYATNVFTANLNLNTSEIQSWLGNQSGRIAFLQIAVVEGGNTETVLPGSTRVVILADPDENNATPASIIPNYTGLVSISNATDTVAVTGLGLATAPTAVWVSVMHPNGGFPLYASVDVSTLSTDGFTAYLGPGVTDSANYKLIYILIF